jgi:hypothetical protein
MLWENFILNDEEPKYYLRGVDEVFSGASHVGNIAALGGT